MQYILTQEEFDNLCAVQKQEIRLNEKKLQELCTKIADTMPVKWGWSKDEEAKPWQCWLTLAKQDDYDEWYCDSCPVQTICPGQKHWSK